ncbi:MAG: hypothetical protein IT260_18315, partial [Saprospiraceae bacterium]|nr:hypothetical protein [Saprospiraceae bacterium]
MMPTLLATPTCTGCGHRFQLDRALHCTTCQLPYGGQAPETLLRQRRILVCKSCRHLVPRNSEQQCSHCGAPQWGYLEFALENNMTLPLTAALHAPPAAHPATPPARVPATPARTLPAAADIPQTNTQWTDIHPGIYTLPPRVFRHPSERATLVITGLLTLPLLGYALYEGY